MADQPRKAVVLLSGGLDSATTAALAREQGYVLYALTFRYGQRHQIETKAAARIGRSLGVARHVEQAIDLRVFGGSALTGSIQMRKAADVAGIPHRIPATYVPARNTIFLSLALAYAEVNGASDIFIGVNAIDYSGYPDCRKEFIAAFEMLANLATKVGVEATQRDLPPAISIRTPLIEMSKADIIREGSRLGVDFSLTHSCYDPGPSGLACGFCDSCLLRKKGFAEAGLADPIAYASSDYHE